MGRVAAYIAENPNWRLLPGNSTLPGGGNNEWTTTKIILAASDANGANAYARVRELDLDLANQVGNVIPFAAGNHTYSGNSFPATYGASNARDDDDYGWNYSVLNVKCDWTDLASGNLDTYITTFVNSIPSGHKVYLLINHEPENDGNPAGAATWCTGQARAANLIAALNDPRCEFAICHMTYTWVPASGRTPSDWNPAPQMTTAAKNRTIFAPDGYTTVRNSSGTSIDTMASIFNACFADATSWGFSRFAISEHSLNNDLNAPVSAVVSWWNTDHLPYIRSKNLEYYAYYNSPGPASGTNSKLDTPQELTMFGNFVEEYKYA